MLSFFKAMQAIQPAAVSCTTGRAKTASNAGLLHLFLKQRLKQQPLSLLVLRRMAVLLQTWPKEAKSQIADPPTSFTG